jgi:hypothetical protein
MSFLSQFLFIVVLDIKIALVTRALLGQLKGAAKTSILGEMYLSPQAENTCRFSFNKT